MRRWWTDVQYRSTRGGAKIGLDDALQRGLAEDGGLFVPDSLPTFDPAAFDPDAGIAVTARRLLAPFFAGSSLADDLPAIIAETLHFPVPVTDLPAAAGYAGLLELYHGPTAAFKDVGAGFLAACLGRLQADPSRPLTILVATSGDTGGAVAAAFDGRPGMRVVVLYPEGRVSGRQERQLTCWGDNVLSLRVSGTFDDCQRVVKAALVDAGLSARRFGSANSINIGRLLPQCTYYAHASLRHWQRTGRKPGFIVPTGNLGNALAAILVREAGLPVGPIVLATNANRSIADYFESLEWLPRPSVQTLATAMDVGDPSNMERLRALLGDAGVLRERLAVSTVEDAAIENAIRNDYAEFGFATCPHTATATHTWRAMPAELRQDVDWILVATAHPAKFETIVEPLIGAAVPVPPELAALLDRPSRATDIEPSSAELAAALEERFGPA